MEREYKGQSILECIDNYVAVDLETTGLDPGYDEIIELAAVRVENSVIVNKFQSLVKPLNDIDSFL